MPDGVTATFAGHKGTSGSPFRLEEMEVIVEVKAGESLRLGISTSGLKPNGSMAGSNELTGWFKVDHFRIERVNENDEDGIVSVSAKDVKEGTYNLAGQRVSDKAPQGIYIQNGKKILR